MKPILPTAVIAAMVASAPISAAPVTTTISYQGRLSVMGQPASGLFDMHFRLWDSAVGGAVVADEAVIGVHVTDGLFNAKVPFDTVSGFAQALWIDVTVDGGGQQATLPRQRICPTPQAIFAISSGTGLGQAYANSSVIFTNAGDPVSIATPNDGLIEIGAVDAANLWLYDDAGAGRPPTVQLDGNGGFGGGELELYNESGARTMSLWPDGNGAGGFIQVLRSPSQAGFVVDGNVSGSNAAAMALFGSAGDTIRFDTSQAGDGSAQFFVDAVNATEMLNEPGVASARGGDADLEDDVLGATISSRSITVPAAGYIVAIGTCEVDLDANSVSRSEFSIGINQSGSLQFDEAMRFSFPADMTSSQRINLSPTVSEVFEVPSSGLYTFRLRIERPANNANDVRANDGRLILMYFPTAYGTATVNTLLAPVGNPASNEQLESMRADLARQRSELEAMRRRFREIESQLTNDRGQQR